MAIRKVFFSHLCILADPDFVRREHGKWILDEIYTNRFFCTAGNAGVSGQRILPWCPWGSHPDGMKDQFAPYELIGANFDLSKFNDYYSPIVRRLIEIARAYEIKTWFCLADNCQFHGPTKKWSPWITNVNGIASIYEAAAYPFFKKWIEKCLVEFSGLNVGWPWGNEMMNPLFLDLAKKVIFPFVESGKIAPANCTYGPILSKAVYDVKTKEYILAASGLQELVKGAFGRKFGEEAELAVWREVHGVGGGDFPAVPNNLDQALSWWGRRRVDNGIRIFVSNDGADGYSDCDRTIYEGKEQVRPSAKTMGEAGKILSEFVNDIIVEHVPKAAKDLACQTKTLKTIYRALFGKDPVEKWHYEPPPPGPPTIVVEVCAESGLLPNEWCPARENRTFVKGEEPTTVCTIHKKPEEKPWWKRLWEWIKRHF